MKLESNFRNMVLVLTVISLVAAGILGGVYTLTAGPIEAAKAAKQQDAIRQVLPVFDRLENDTVKGLALHKAYQGDAFVGTAVESEANGFSGTIKIMVGFDKDGNIVDYSVLEQKETPGLGTKIVDWFKTDKGNQNIKGKSPSRNNLTVSKDQGEVDAITAATISSRAFLSAVNTAYAAFAADSDAPGVNADAMTGATSTSAEDATTGATAVATGGNDTINALNQ